MVVGLELELRYERGIGIVDFQVPNWPFDRRTKCDERVLRHV